MVYQVRRKQECLAVEKVENVKLINTKEKRDREEIDIKINNR